MYRILCVRFASGQFFGEPLTLFTTMVGVKCVVSEEHKPQAAARHASTESLLEELSSASSVPGRLPVKAEKSISRLRLHPLTPIREDRHAVFPMPLQQDTEVFGAQGILSSGAATDIIREHAISHRYLNTA
jgi:hypothetical protein